MLPFYLIKIKSNSFNSINSIKIYPKLNLLNCLYLLNDIYSIDCFHYIKTKNQYFHNKEKEMSKNIFKNKLKKYNTLLYLIKTVQFQESGILTKKRKNVRNVP
jgi:hypothetical protein